MRLVNSILNIVVNYIYYYSQSIIMKYVKIRKNNKRTLDELSEGNQYNDKVNNLMNEVEDYLPLNEVDYSPITSIQLTDDTVERLESFKLTDGESYENIIVRLLLTKDLYMKLNNIDNVKK